MKIELRRYRDTGIATFGKIFIDDEFQCYTLEDIQRNEKIVGETRIPSGDYVLAPRRYGKFYEKYKDKFSHSFAIEICDVPNFTDVLIHIGNTDADTRGCVLVGDRADENANAIYASTNAYLALYEKIALAVYEQQALLRILDEWV